MPKHIQKIKPGMKVQVGQESRTLQDDRITMILWYVYKHYHAFLIKCTIDNKMKKSKVTLKIDNMHFFSQLLKCMIISWLIDIFMEISYPTEKIYFYFPLFPRD